MFHSVWGSKLYLFSLFVVLFLYYFLTIQPTTSDPILVKQNKTITAFVESATNSSFKGDYSVPINKDEVEVPGWGLNISRNLHDYILTDVITATILPEHLCDRSSLLVIMVTTAPSNREARMAIRETWGTEKNLLGYNVSIYYMMGQTDNETVRKLVSQEADEHKDIIQEEFKDTYNNLTIKSAFSLKNFNLACAKNSEYLVKIDDDMFLSVPKLVTELAQQSKSGRRNLIMGYVMSDVKPVRNPDDKWYAPTYLYAGYLYPTYTSGTGYLMSKDAAEKIFLTAMDTPIFYLEDIYFTGICAKINAITPIHNPLFTYAWLTPKDDICMILRLITTHHHTPEDIRMIFNATFDSNTTNRCAQDDTVKALTQGAFMARL